MELQLSLRKQTPLASDLIYRQASQTYREGRQFSKQESGWLDDLERELGDRPVAGIKNSDLKAVAIKLYPKARNETRNRQVLTPAAAVLHYAAEDGAIPWLRVSKLPEREPETRAVSRDIARVLIANTEGQQQAFLIFLFRQGWRVSEVLRLEWRHLDLKERSVNYHNRKADVWKLMPLAEDVVSALSCVPPERRFGRVFSWGNKSNVYRWLRPLCRKLGVHFTPHMARHSVATWAINDGASPLDLMEAYGWRDLKSVKRYGTVSMERARKIIDQGKK